MIIRILGDMPQAELREDKVEAVSSLVQLQSQVAIVVAKVYHWTHVSLALSQGQSVLFGVKRANRLPLRTIFRGIERQFQRSIVASVACRVVKTDAAFGFLQGNVNVGFRLVYHLFLLLRDVPCAVVDGADITVEHLSETFPVFSWQIAREHACVESYRRFDKLIDIIAPLGLLHQHLFIHTLARHRNRIVAVHVETQAALLAQLPLTANEDACRVVAHLYRWRQPLADGTHRSGDDAIACDVGHNIREHLVVVFVVELQLHDARQTAHHLLLREGGNRVHRCLVVAKSRVVSRHHAQLSVDVLRVAYQQISGEHVQALQTVGATIVHQQQLIVVGSPSLLCHQRHQQQQQKQYLLLHKCNFNNSGTKLQLFSAECKHFTQKSHINRH